MSTMNPADMAAMKQAGENGMGKMANVGPDTTIRDFFSRLGVDVDGPVTQLQQFAQNEIEKGDPLNKMENIAATTPPSAGDANPPPQAPPGGMPSAAPGLDGLMM